MSKLPVLKPREVVRLLGELNFCGSSRTSSFGTQMVARRLSHFTQGETSRRYCSGSSPEISD